MKIRFDGVPGEEHDGVTMYGQDFPKGKYVDVTGYQAQQKLSRHPHFTVKPGDEDDGAKPIVKIDLPQTIPYVETANLTVTQSPKDEKKAHR